MRFSIRTVQVRDNINFTDRVQVPLTAFLQPIESPHA